jgi:hypothetical protein
MLPIGAVIDHGTTHVDEAVGAGLHAVLATVKVKETKMVPNLEVKEDHRGPHAAIDQDAVVVDFAVVT